MIIYSILNSHDKKVLSKWKQYETLIDFHGNTNLDDLAAQCGKSYKKICHDIQEMIDAKVFGESNGKNGAYIDYEEHYLVMLSNGKPKVSLYALPEEEIDVENETSIEEDVEQVEDDEYIVQCINYIKAAMEDIGNKENKYSTDKNVKKNLASMEKSLEGIHAKVKNHPEFEKNTEIIKLNNFHLPHAMDLIENYLDETASEKSLKEITDVLEISMKAFSRMDKELSEAMDAETMANIEVLKSAFERDGLTESDFEIDVN